MKFHNYSSPPEKVKTRSVSSSSEQESTLLQQPQQQQQPTDGQKQQQISLKKKITPQQLLELQQQQQREPLAKRPRIDESVPAEVEQHQAATEEEEEELDTSATESETEMDQSTDNEMIVSHPSQRLDANALKAKAASTTAMVVTTDDSDYGQNDKHEQKFDGVLSDFDHQIVQDQVDFVEMLPQVDGNVQLHGDIVRPHDEISQTVGYFRHTRPEQDVHLAVRQSKDAR